jgi:hypothetical protein
MKLLKQASVAVLAALSFSAGATSLVIDDFMAPAAGVQIIDTSDGVNDGTNGASNITLGSMVFGSRQIYINCNSGCVSGAFPVGANMLVGATPFPNGRLTYRSDPGVDAFGLVRWNGAGALGSFAPSMYDGLQVYGMTPGASTVDMTPFNFVRVIVLEDDLPFTFTLQLFDNAGQAAQVNLAAPGGIISSTVFDIPLAAFVGIDLTNIAGMQAYFSGVALDIQIDLAEARLIPQPGTLALLGLALAGLGFTARRRKA